MSRGAWFAVIAALGVTVAVAVVVLQQDEAGPMKDHSDDGEVTVGFINGVASNITLRPIGNGKMLRRDAAERFNAMRAAALRDGVTFFVNSGFRTMAEQVELHRLYLAGTGNLAAAPGYSNHQGGLSADISTNNQGRASAQYKWLSVHARDFGFVNDVTSEAWHWTYLPDRAAQLGGRSVA